MNTIARLNTGYCACLCVIVFIVCLMCLSGMKGYSSSAALTLMIFLGAILFISLTRGRKDK